MGGGTGVTDRQGKPSSQNEILTKIKNINRIDSKSNELRESEREFSNSSKGNTTKMTTVDRVRCRRRRDEGRREGGVQMGSTDRTRIMHSI